MNGAAIPLVNVKYDIDSILRHVSLPDLGAKEFSLCANDAGINAMLAPSSPLTGGVQAIEVELQNHGTNTLSSVEIQWTVNGITQPTFNWTGNLNTGAFETVNIGSYNFSGASSFDVVFRTKQPNGLTDCNNYNDTTAVLNLVPTLCGTYTIGGSSPDFLDFTTAVTALNNGGVSCPVVFEVRDGVYNEQIIIREIAGASAINTVTFRSQSRDSSKVELDFNTVNPLYYTILLENTSHLTFADLTINISGPGYALKCEGVSESISIKNCDINDFSFESGAGVYSQDISIENCIIKGSCWVNQVKNLLVRNNRNGGNFRLTLSEDTLVNIVGNHMSVLSISSGKNYQILDNFIESGFGSTISLSSTSTVNNVLIQRNRIHNSVFSNTTGIHAYNSNHRIIENIITGHKTGILISNNYSGNDSCLVVGNRLLGQEEGTGISIQSSRVTVVNNYITTKGATNGKGIYLGYGANDIVVFNNSIDVQNINLTQACAIEINNAGSNLSVRNNILSNSAGGYAIRAENFSIPAGMFDYNDVWTSGTNLGFYIGTSYPDLLSWSTAISGEANGVSKNPLFVSDTDLLPYQRALNGAGIGIASVIVDIDGELRNQAAPDIGAQEFTIDFGITDLINPSGACDQTANEDVTVFLRQFGDIPFQNLKIAYQLNGGTVYTETIPGSTENSLVYTFSQQQNLLGFGTYDFKIWLVNQNDDNINNDTLHIVRVVDDAPVVDFNFGTNCAGEAISFDGNATVGTGSINAYEWFFGDSTVAYSEDPSHSFPYSGSFLTTFKAFTDKGCYAAVSKQVDILNTPIANFDIVDSCNNNTASFINQSSSNSGSITHKWDFGNGQYSTQENPSIQFVNHGPHAISLIVSQVETGCTDTLTKNIEFLQANATSSDEICGLPNSGTLVSHPSGGVLPYSFIWNTTPSSSDSLVTDLAPGAYILALTDAAGCTVYDTLTINSTVDQLNYDTLIVSACGSYTTTYGRTLTVSGTYRDTITYNGACDTLHITQIQIFEEFVQEPSFTALKCGSSLSMPSGKLILNDGIHYDTLNTVNGCDSVFKWTVNFEKYLRDTATVVTCDKFLSITNKIYSQTGIYSDTLNLVGCDSIITTYLTINESYFQQLNYANQTCGTGIISPTGKLLSATGTYYDTLQSINGCDSVFEITISFDPFFHSTKSVTSCGEFVTASGKIVTGSGLFVDTLNVMSACDTIFTYDIEISDEYLTEKDVLDLECGSSFISPTGKQIEENTLLFDTLQALNGCDSVLKLNISFNTYYNLSLSREACEFLTLPSGGVVSSSGQYIDTVHQLNVCDTIYSIAVIIDEFKNGVITSKSCEPIVSPSGKVYAVSGVYSDTVSTQFICDSIYEIQFEKLEKDFAIKDSATILACSPYELPSGRIIQSTGSFIDTAFDKNSCPIVKYFEATFEEPTLKVLNLEVCGAFVAPNGDVYTESGRYYNRFTNRAGCDSIIQINLTINAVAKDTVDIITCGMYISPSEKIYHQSGFYIDTAHYENGCDSIKYINLTILPQPFNRIISESCDFFVRADGRLIFETGIYYDTLKTKIGCDSIVRIDFSAPNFIGDTIFVEDCEPLILSNGQLISAPGLYVDTVFNEGNCGELIPIFYSHPDTFLETVQLESCEPIYINDSLSFYQSGIYVDSLISEITCDTIRMYIVTISDSIPVQISSNNLTLNASGNFDAIQWLNCNANFSVIIGANANLFTGIVGGAYAAVVELNGCADTTACFSLNPTAIDPIAMSGSEIDVYPNPNNTGLLKLKNLPLGDLRFRILTRDGKLLNDYKGNRSTLKEIELPKNSGVYILEIESDGLIFRKRVVRL